jgi:hypothetical protein
VGVEPTRIRKKPHSRLTDAFLLRANGRALLGKAFAVGVQAEKGYEARFVASHLALEQLGALL